MGEQTRRDYIVCLKYVKIEYVSSRNVQYLWTDIFKSRLAKEVIIKYTFSNLFSYMNYILHLKYYVVIMHIFKQANLVHTVHDIASLNPTNLIQKAVYDSITLLTHTHFI